MGFNLDQYQNRAVSTKYRNTLVVAAPGSGKTTVIINRVYYLVTQKNVNPENIVVITFTKAAANNMKKRYEELNPRGGRTFFGTFHGLFYKILRRHLGEINIIEGNESYHVIYKVLIKYLDEIGEEKVKEVLNHISLFKSGKLPMEEFKPCIDKNIFVDCYNTYETYKKSKGLLDFDDLQKMCRDLFINNPKVLKGYSKLFKFILVDEFQDCDEIQLEILSMLNENNSIFAVGDEDQCIYSFRGSKPEYMVRFNDIFKEGEKIFLNYNYRSAKNIIEASKALISNNKLRNAKEINAYRKDSKLIIVREVLDENIQSEDIAQKIISFNNEYKYSDNAVLYRTNIEARSIIDNFIRKKIPFVLLDKEYNFFEHFICKDLIAYLKLSIDPYDRHSFCRIINRPFRYVSKINIEKVKHSNSSENCFEILKNIEGIQPFQMRFLEHLKKDILYLNKINLKTAIDFIIMDLGYLEYLQEYSKKFKMKIEELEEILEEFKNSAEGYSSIIMFLSHIDMVSEEIKNSKKRKYEDSVILSTIHGVKGMEFKNVFIINCDEEVMPHANSMENIEEERRLFYVGITRTIDNLHIYSTRYIRGKKMEPSRFIFECNIKNDRIAEIPYKEGDMVYHDNFKEGKIKYINLSSNEIDIEFPNGIIRKFNFDILYRNKLIKKIG